jgi:Tfp pilus assembly protein PilP
VSAVSRFLSAPSQIAATARAAGLAHAVAAALVCVCLLIDAPASAQEKKPAPAPGTAGQPSATTGVAPPPTTPPYSYDPEGRRDPFVSLLTRGSDPKPTSTRPAGLPGMLVAEVSVKGIIRDRTGYIAMIQGTGTRTFTVRAGEKLMDGTIKAITADTVVFSEDVSDPLSMVKQKEVRKTVRPSDGGR